MTKKEFTQMLASSLEELIENDVLYVETEAVYDPYSGHEAPAYKSTIHVNSYALEEYLKTL
jgi:hypothetical protein|nr:MAG TPA: hypothetical protein [Caudoviricetes sp.]